MPIAIAVWIAGCLWNLITAGLGCVRLNQICRDARVVNDSKWEQLLHEACKDLRLIAQCIVCEWSMRFFKVIASGSCRVAWMWLEEVW